MPDIPHNAMAIKADTTFSLKDQLFNETSVSLLAAHIKRADAQFPSKKFVAETIAPFAELELKQRIHRIVDVLVSYLPDDFRRSVALLERALPEPLDPTKHDDDFGEFIWVVPGEYVARQGCTQRHLKQSLGFLREATKRFSSEAAIRPFLINFPEQTLEFVMDCTRDDNYHVRRLASEGIRPFLPWAPRANVPVDQIVNVLDHLYRDPTRYVVRSVANTLNDISRIEADTTINTLKRWQQNHTSKELDWLTRHALRTLLKEDNPTALGLLGYATKPEFKIDKLKTSKTVKVGEQFAWSCRLISAKRQKLKINLCIHFLKARGKYSPKVFAVKDAEFNKGEQLAIDKKQWFKPMTTRVLYPGQHFAELSVNGVVCAKQTFELVP